MASTTITTAHKVAIDNNSTDTIAAAYAAAAAAFTDTIATCATAAAAAANSTDTVAAAAAAYASTSTDKVAACAAAAAASTDTVATYVAASTAPDTTNTPPNTLTDDDDEVIHSFYFHLDEATELKVSLSSSTADYSGVLTFKEVIPATTFAASKAMQNTKTFVKKCSPPSRSGTPPYTVKKNGTITVTNTAITDKLADLNLNATDYVRLSTTVPLTQKDMEAISYMPFFDDSFKRKRDQFTVTRNLPDTNVYFHYKGCTLRLREKAWKELQTITEDLFLDHTYLSHYFKQGKKQHWSPKRDVSMLRQLTGALGKYYYDKMTYKLSHQLCSNHILLWSNSHFHENNCNENNTNTVCYAMAKIALRQVTTDCLVTILQCNGLKTHDLSMADIIGGDSGMTQLLKDIHSINYYLLSDLMVENALHKLSNKYLTAIQDGCYYCQNVK